MNYYTLRNKCIFCNSLNLNIYFDKNYEIPIASYNIEENKDIIKIPFNVLYCNECFTFQTKYLGDLNEIYKNNHADNCGTIRTEMNDKFSELINKTIPNISNILEIGAGSGILSLSIYNILPNIEYNIIDPFYFGIIENRKIIYDYLENVDLELINTNIVVMSHVFEHFYEPLKIIEKLYNSKNIEYICLNFPDLETYITNKTFNILHPEHTYYIENDFLKQFFYKYGFETILEEKFKEHSIFLIFKRIYVFNNNIIIFNNNSLSDINNYYKNINDTVNKYNNYLSLIDNNINKYIFPCSIHTMYLFIFGLNPNYFKAILDNSKNKINKYLYGYDLLCHSYNNIIDNNENSLIILNGGCFNKEMNLNKSSNILYLI